jgi:CheY-like chemotaxis protein/anti-sigma regulatory factor (Ser/Thr protein kinase)
VPPSRVVAIRPAATFLDPLRAIVDARGCEIESCAGDVEAVRRIRDFATDVVVTDPAAPVEEGLALVSELLQIRPALRIIVLAPSADHEDVVAAIRSNVFACFTPPIDYLEVADMVSNALRADTWQDGIQVVSGLDRWVTLRVNCHLLTAERLIRFMTELQRDTGPADRDLLIAAFREMLLNAMEHGAGFDSEKVIEVTAAKTKRAIVYHFKDPGEGFDRANLQHSTMSPEPDDVIATAIARAEMGLRPGGFGMLIARQVADELVYNERGNEVILIKHLD